MFKGKKKELPGAQGEGAGQVNYLVDVLYIFAFGCSSTG